MRRKVSHSSEHGEFALEVSGLVGSDAEPAKSKLTQAAFLRMPAIRLILLSYWRESYVELLWLSARARRAGLGSRLIEEAEHRAQKRGSRLIHLNTYSFQAPGFYEKHGYQRFGRMSGSPQGASRHFYVKRLRAI